MWVKNSHLGSRLAKALLPSPGVLAALSTWKSSLPGPWLSSLAFFASPSISSKLSQILQVLLHSTKHKSGPFIQGLWQYIQVRDTAGRRWLTLSTKSYQLNLECYWSLCPHIVLLKMIHSFWKCEYNFSPWNSSIAWKTFYYRQSLPSFHLSFKFSSFPPSFLAFSLPSAPLLFLSFSLILYSLGVLKGSRICCCGIRIILNRKHLKINEFWKRFFSACPSLAGKHSLPKEFNHSKSPFKGGCLH